MKQTLYLLRHAEPEPWQADSEDFGRDLSRSGRRQARWLVDELAEEVRAVERVLCSPALRAVQTLRPWLEKRPDLLRVADYCPSLYLASPGTLHALAQDAFEAFNAVLIVGHNPGLQALARHFADARPGSGARAMRPASLVAFDFADGFSLDAPAVTERLWLTRPESLAD